MKYCINFKVSHTYDIVYCLISIQPYSSCCKLFLLTGCIKTSVHVTEVKSYCRLAVKMLIKFFKYYMWHGWPFFLLQHGGQTWSKSVVHILAYLTALALPYRFMLVLITKTFRNLVWLLCSCTMLCTQRSTHAKEKWYLSY